MKFLFWCAHLHLDFKIPEFESICQITGIKYSWIEKERDLPWVILDLESVEDARKILSRSISTKHCIQVWAQANSYEEFHSNLKKFPFNEYQHLMSDKKSFKINVEAYTKKVDLKQKLVLIESMDYLPLEGAVDLNNPDVQYSYLEFWGHDNNNLPEQPYNVFFGLNIGEGQRHLITKQSIKSRKFIGNTTMDPYLAFLMANLGKVGSTSLVLDPFVGTGSLLLAAAEFKGHVFGGDIDFLQLHAKTKSTRAGETSRGTDESMVANFEQYGLTSYYGDVIACDASKSPWRSDMKFDVIITDPPYGIREQMTRVGTDKDYSASSIPEHYLDKHIPEKVSYTLESILEDLLNFSADRLCIGGRLVYWLPVIRQNYQKELLPSHPSLKFLYDCEQILTSHTCRRLIVMEKTCDTSEKAVVYPEITRFREQFYLPLAGNIDRKERKERIKKFGHLNMTEEEMVKFAEVSKARTIHLQNLVDQRNNQTNSSDLHM